MTRGSAPPLADAGWAYFLDVDGTLAPLAPTPDAARVTERTLRVVRTLHARTQGAVALVSGRAIADIDQLFGLPPIPAAGQHGTELRTDLHSEIVKLSINTELTPAREAFGAFAARHAGVLLEDKGQSLAMHYRLAPALAPSVHRLVRTELRAIGSHYRMQAGRCVVELRPADADKGQAVAAFMWLAPFRGRVPVFIGDDVTDEDGFEHVNLLGGHSIRVGKGRTAARYRLRDSAAVVDWLEASGSRA